MPDVSNYAHDRERPQVAVHVSVLYHFTNGVLVRPRAFRKQGADNTHMGRVYESVDANSRPCINGIRIV
jgi:hypothetical protein